MAAVGLLWQGEAARYFVAGAGMAEVTKKGGLVAALLCIQWVLVCQATTSSG